MHIYFIKTTDNNYNSFCILKCECNTNANEQNKVLSDNSGVSVANDAVGLQIKVKFTKGNTNTAPKILDKTVIAGGYLKPEMFSGINSVMELLFDGNNWIITGGIYNNE